MHSERLVFPDSASGISAAKNGKQAFIGTVALTISISRYENEFALVISFAWTLCESLGFS